VEVYLERRLESKIRASNGIQVVAEAGGVVGGGESGDLFLGAKGLLGTKGAAGAFMDPDRLVARWRLQDLLLDDFELDLDLPCAEPFSDRFEWTFATTISDAMGIDINAVLYYGDVILGNVPPTSIQTHCDLTKYGVEDLEDSKPRCQLV
jgi:hypothetical protein